MEHHSLRMMNGSRDQQQVYDSGMANGSAASSAYSASNSLLSGGSNEDAEADVDYYFTRTSKRSPEPTVPIFWNDSGYNKNGGSPISSIQSSSAFQSNYYNRSKPMTTSPKISLQCQPKMCDSHQRDNDNDKIEDYQQTVSGPAVVSMSSQSLDTLPSRHRRPIIILPENDDEDDDQRNVDNFRASGSVSTKFLPDRRQASFRSGTGIDREDIQRLANNALQMIWELRQQLGGGGRGGGGGGGGGTSASSNPASSQHPTVFRHQSLSSIPQSIVNNTPQHLQRPRQQRTRFPSEQDLVHRGFAGQLTHENNIGILGHNNKYADDQSSAILLPVVKEKDETTTTPVSSIPPDCCPTNDADDHIYYEIEDGIIDSSTTGGRNGADYNKNSRSSSSITLKYPQHPNFDSNRTRIMYRPPPPLPPRNVERSFSSASFSRRPPTSTNGRPLMTTSKFSKTASGSMSSLPTSFHQHLAHFNSINNNKRRTSAGALPRHIIIQKQHQHRTVVADANILSFGNSPQPQTASNNSVTKNVNFARSPLSPQPGPNLQWTIPETTNPPTQV